MGPVPPTVGPTHERGRTRMKNSAMPVSFFALCNSMWVLYLLGFTSQGQPSGPRLEVCVGEFFEQTQRGIRLDVRLQARQTVRMNSNFCITTSPATPTPQPQPKRQNEQVPMEAVFPHNCPSSTRIIPIWMLFFKPHSGTDHEKQDPARVNSKHF